MAIKGMCSIKPNRFRVAFSFAGEKRYFVEEVATYIAAIFGKEAVLYDKYHEAEFARVDLGIYLPKLYNNDSDLIVVILCSNYDKKRWTGWEWLHIYELLNNSNYNRVMPCRFGYVNVDGLSHASGYVELDDKKPTQLSHIILERLAQNEGRPKDFYIKMQPSFDGASKNDLPEDQFNWVTKLHESTPLLDQNKFYKWLSDANWPMWKPPEVGMYGFRKLRVPESVKELNVLSFEASDVILIKLYSQVDENYTLQILFPTLYKQKILSNIEIADFFGDFWKNTKVLKIIPGTIENIKCTECGSCKSIFTSKSCPECSICFGEGLTRCRLHCQRIFPKNYNLLWVAEPNCKTSFFPEKYKVLFETEVVNLLPDKFPFELDGLNNSQLIVLNENYNKVKDKITQELNSNYVSEPKMILDNATQNQLINMNIENVNVKSNGFKVVLGGTTYYHSAYNREVAHHKGFFWNKENFILKLRGEVFSYIAQDILIKNNEEIIEELPFRSQ